MANDEQVTALERQIEQLKAQVEDLRGQLAELELDQWKARIDDLEVQMHLGAMGAMDRLTPLVEKLRNSYLDARSSVSGTATAAGDATDRIRKGLEAAMTDIRKAVFDDGD
ncbi:MAG: hypothetical protein JST64_07660 [Actinobacteria bacterium]|nr:hypothetical protein [Actinomycetota bacterium]